MNVAINILNKIINNNNLLEYLLQKHRTKTYNKYSIYIINLTIY